MPTTAPAHTTGRGRRREWVEITDLLLDVSSSGALRLVHRETLVQTLVGEGDRWGARLVRRMPASADGVLDRDHIDRLLVAVHAEIQHLSEEFRHGERVWRLLRPVLRRIRDPGIPPPYRVVDVGCGTGYVVRWLTANVGASDVEFVGIDLNAALVREARVLARVERLPCRFEVGDALVAGEPATVVISTGLLHHLRGGDLERLFAAHAVCDVAAFVHIDFQPSPLAALGSRLVHRARMRLPVSRHDGVRSAQRAHDPRLVVRVAAHQAPGHVSQVVGRRVWGTPLPCVLSKIVGVRADVIAATRANDPGAGSATWGPD